MTSKTGKTSLKYKTDLKPQSFAVVMAGTSAQIAGLLYVWKEYTSFGETIEKCGTDAKCYMNTEDPWSRQVVITAGIITVTWILSLILGFGGFGHGTPGTADPSIVDRLWSILPPLYVWGCYFSTKTSTGEPSLRLLAMAVLSTIWSCRLTYNFAIKGGFSGGEDYRWEHLRRWFPGLQWEAFNLVFICTFQHLLIMGFTTPAAYAMQMAADAPANDWNIYDTIAASSYFLLFLGETIADRQMFAFQTEKYRRKGAKEALGPVYGRGFIWSGLWKYSRHPNYFCEVSMWWAFYMFAVASWGPDLSSCCLYKEFLNWSILPVIYLTLLFTAPGASLDFAEALSSQKYKDYRIYQQRVSRFFPWFPSEAPKEKDA